MQYWIFRPANQFIHSINIHLALAWSDRTTHTILDNLSGWPMDTLSQYLFSICLIRPDHPHNIGYPVRLTDGYLESIFIYHSPDPTGPPTQYWITCPADQWIHWVNIYLASAWSDRTTHTILDNLSRWPMDTLSQYLFSIRLIRPDHPHNIG